ncbi:isochorismate synthase [Leucobacter sp. W1153]|uniref:isochorismate synthase n=1 Tax=Leucobacter sp. W1153 TaxID=3439064 RepID=UPI003F2A5DB1
MNSGSPHRLFAVTRPLASLPTLDDLLSFADPSQPLLWTRGDRGGVGVGETLRLTFTGPERFAQASTAWRNIAAVAEIDDPVGLPGTGLVAFGTFAFDSASEAESVLIVPRVIVARHRGTAWLTEISVEPTDRDPQLPVPTSLGSWSGVDLPTTEPNSAYLAGVRDASSRIASGAAEKIVLSRQVRGLISAEDDLRVPLGRLAERYSDCWTFAVDGMLGASPETLIRQTDGAISARVLAGTRARGSEPTADARARDELLTSTKEQHEHAFAVQSVVTALAPHVAELHTSEEPFALQLPNVWHLATDLGATPGAGGTSLELTAALHPTAAVAGTPTSSAVESIAEIEPFDRGRYAGAVGWIDAAGDGEWVIALRCAQVGPAVNGNREVTATAGGGIVAGSDPHREFRETVSKFTPITEAFGA